MSAALFLLVALGALDLLLLRLALGSWRALLERPPALVMLGVWAAAGLWGTLARPRRPPAPARRAAEPRWVLPGLALLPLGTLFLSAWCAARGWGMLPGGAALEWAGAGIAAAGSLLRAAAVIQLGRYFTPGVQVQEGHALATGGLYARLRHPGYLGALASAAGSALVFRSGAGLALAALMLVTLRLRIRGEESLLAGHFGEDYERYRRRSGALWPRRAPSRAFPRPDA